MTNFRRLARQIQQTFFQHNIVLGEQISLHSWCQSSVGEQPHSSSSSLFGWQEIAFAITLETRSHEMRTNPIVFQGIDVFWGNAEYHSMLFGSDCAGLQQEIGKRDFWTLLLPFCETVLSLSQHSNFAPLIRVDVSLDTDVVDQHPQTLFFQLPNFNYQTLEWSHLVPSLATPIAIGA